MHIHQMPQLVHENQSFVSNAPTNNSLKYQEIQETILHDESINSVSPKKRSSKPTNHAQHNSSLRSNYADSSEDVSTAAHPATPYNNSLFFDSSA